MFHLLEQLLQQEHQWQEQVLQLVDDAMVHVFNIRIPHQDFLTQIKLVVDSRGTRCPTGDIRFNRVNQWGQLFYPVASQRNTWTCARAYIQTPTQKTTRFYTICERYNSVRMGPKLLGNGYIKQYGTVRIARANATSSVSSPDRSGPNRIALRPSAWAIS